MQLYDYLAFGFVLLLYLGYHLLYLYFSFRKREGTRETVIAYHRKIWVDLVSRSNNAIIGIQTIRNLEMVHTFLISLTMLIMGGIISIFSAHLDWLQAMESGSYLEFLQNHSVAIKLLAVLGFVLIAFSNFVFGLRINFNMNFTVSTAGENPQDLRLQYEQVQRQARHFITGIRALYHSLMPLVWIVSTTGMLMLALVSTYLFYRFDYWKIPGGRHPDGRSRSEK